MSRHLLTPRIKPLSSRRSTILSVLDVGTSKIVCLIAKLLPAEPSDLLRGRTHRCKILGIGHQRAQGIKSGVVIDMEDTEKAIRLAVDAAERMAGVEVESVIVNMTGGRIGSQLHRAGQSIGGKAVLASDIQRFGIFAAILVLRISRLLNRRGGSGNHIGRRGRIRIGWRRIIIGRVIGRPDDEHAAAMMIAAPRIGADRRRYCYCSRNYRKEQRFTHKQTLLFI